MGLPQHRKKPANVNETIILAVLMTFAAENAELRKQNEELISLVEELQCTIEKQTRDFAAEVSQMHKEHQHLQSSLKQTTEQQTSMYSGIQQLINTCAKLNEENKTLQMQLQKMQHAAQDTGSIIPSV